MIDTLDEILRGPEIARAPAPVHFDTVAAQRAISRELGAKVIASLHEVNHLYDWLWMAGVWLVFVALCGALANLAFGPLWLLALFAQGIVLQNIAQVGHEIFVHRELKGGRLGHLLGIVNLIPVLMLPTKYKLSHLEHHKLTGTDRAEAYKFCLDTRRKRFLFMTFVGVVLVRRGRLKTTDARAAATTAPNDISAAKVSAASRRRIRLERKVLRLFYLALVLAALLWPRQVIYGYVLPLVLALPVVNLLRIVLEHAEADVRSLYHCATYYRTGPITRILFFWNVGDCHLIHHIYPRISWYRMGRAIKLMRPLFLKQGMHCRRSMLGLLYGYLIENRPYLTIWHT